jgi:hypothetical protein
MRLVLHPKVYSDIDEIMAYYERVATRQLADEFYAELLAMLCEFSSCDTTGDVPLLPLGADSGCLP